MRLELVKLGAVLAAYGVVLALLSRKRGPRPTSSSGGSGDRAPPPPGFVYGVPLVPPDKG